MCAEHDVGAKRIECRIDGMLVFSVTEFGPMVPIKALRELVGLGFIGMEHRRERLAHDNSVCNITYIWLTEAGRGFAK